MTKTFLITRRHGARWDDARPMEEQAEWQAHADFMDGLASEGWLLLVGPVEGTRDALLVVRAEGEDEIRERLASDPWTRNGLLRTAEIREWTVRIGAKRLEG